MYTLGSKSLVINDAALVTIAGNVMSIPGFGSIDNSLAGYTKTITTGTAIILSTIDIAGALPGEEVAVYWKNRRYIGEGMGNKASGQAPWVLMIPTGSTVAEAFQEHEEAFGTSELFTFVAPGALTAKNTAIEILESKNRPIPTADNPFEAGTGFRYNRFGGVVLTAGSAGNEGIGTGPQVEESIRHSIGSNVDPYSNLPHGSEVVELEAIYDIYDFEVPSVGAANSFAVHENIGTAIADQAVATKLIKLRIYAKQGDASVPIAGF